MCYNVRCDFDKSRRAELIESIKCIKNLGPFKSVRDVKLAQTTLIFAENGRGKTMLSEAFRSLATGQPDLVAGRARVGDDGGEPLIVLGQTGDSKVLRWEEGVWHDDKLKIAVFNDGFVDANVCSGLEVAPSHLQGLHSVAVGEEGVRKALLYRQAGAEVTDARRAMEEAAQGIQKRIGNGFKVDEFVARKPCPNIDDKISKNEAALKAATNAARIRQRSKLKPLPTPRVDLETIRSTLSRSIDDMAADVSLKVNTHLSKLWDGAESWVNVGWSNAGSHDACPYCGQSLANSQLVDLFQHYFGERYQDAKNEIENALRDFKLANDGSSRPDLVAITNRNLELLDEWESDGLKASQRTEFDAEAAAATWQELTDGVVRSLERKVDAPLESVKFDQRTLEIVDGFHVRVSAIKAENNHIAAVNAEIERLVAETEHGDVEELEQKARRLQCRKLRGEPEFEELCANYNVARTELEKAQRSRDHRRKEMSQHNESAFRRYGAAINHHLGRFNVGFRIDELKGVSPGGVVTSQFGIVINNEDVKLNSPNQSASFRNTLSGGDRTALALAFFFASLDQRPAPEREETVVVIDDPLSSLDEGRRSKTVATVGRYPNDFAQLIMLSHDKRFLCQFGRRLRNRGGVVGLTVDYEGDGSTIGDWNLEEACRRDEEARGMRMQRFVNGCERASPLLYRDIRLHIENYLMLAFPSEFAASSGVGDFLGHHERDNGLYKANPLLSSARVEELRDLYDYSSDELHWNIVSESDENELRSYVRQTLEFCRGESLDPVTAPD